MKNIDRLIGKIAYILWDIKEGGQRLDEFYTLKKLETQAPAAIEKLQSEKLDKLIKHAGKSSEWYKNIIATIGIDTKKNITLKDLALFPVTTKMHIRDNTEKFISSDHSKNSLNRAKTGGSTGVSLQLFFDEPVLQPFGEILP